jgi:hypothetical protein
MARREGTGDRVGDPSDKAKTAAPGGIVGPALGIPSELGASLIRGAEGRLSPTTGSPVCICYDRRTEL